MSIGVFLSVEFCFALKTYLKGAPFYNASGCARCVSSRTEHPSHRSLAARVSAEAATILLRCYAVALYKGTAKAVGIVKPY